MDSFHFLIETNEFCEWIWPYYFKMMITSVFIAVVMTIVSILFGFYITGHFTTNYLYRPFRWM